MEERILAKFLIDINALENSEKVTKLFLQFLQCFELSAQITIHEQGINLTLIGDELSISLLWWHSKKSYSPQLSKLSNLSLVNISISRYEMLWSAFNAVSHQLWLLPVLHSSILELLCSGKTIEQIATECKLSVSSIKKYLKTIRDTFQAKTNAQAIAIAIRNGYL